MLNLLGVILNKNTLYIIGVLAIIGSLGALYYTQHILPIKKLEKTVVILQKTITTNKKDYEIKEASLIRQISVVGTKLNNCESNLTAQSLNGFIEGVQQDDEITNIDLNSLHT